MMYDFVDRYDYKILSTFHQKRFFLLPTGPGTPLSQSHSQLKTLNITLSVSRKEREQGSGTALISKGKGLTNLGGGVGGGGEW